MKNDSGGSLLLSVTWNGILMLQRINIRFSNFVANFANVVKKLKK